MAIYKQKSRITNNKSKMCLYNLSREYHVYNTMRERLVFIVRSFDAQLLIDLRLYLSFVAYGSLHMPWLPNQLGTLELRLQHQDLIQRNPLPRIPILAILYSFLNNQSSSPFFPILHLSFLPLNSSCNSTFHPLPKEDFEEINLSTIGKEL